MPMGKLVKYTGKSKSAKRPVVAVRVGNLEKKVKKLVNEQERKRWDVQSLPNTFNYNGAVYPLNEIPFGDNDYQRNGSDAYMSSINIRGAFQMITGYVATTVRMVLVNLKLPRGGNITWGEMAQDAIAGTVPTQLGTSLAPHFRYNFGTRHGFEILHDQTYELNETANNSIKFNINRKLNRKVFFNEQTTQVEKNKLYLCFISDATGPGEPLVEFTSRIYFSG